VSSRKRIKVGDLVRLNSKGQRFVYGKVLCSPYYKPILKGNLGLVINVLGSKGDKIRVVWFVRDGQETTNRQTIIMTLSQRYLLRLNKR